MRQTVYIQNETRAACVLSRLLQPTNASADSEDETE